MHRGRMTVGGAFGPEPGALVAGRYRVDSLIGVGGMGSVWLATDELLHRRVAMKRVRFGNQPLADAALARERTMREARIAAALQHPNIVTIYDVLVEEGEPWLVLEYLASRSLGNLLAERGALPPAEVTAIGTQIAAGLAEAHRLGIVHRDVKPDNVLIESPPADSRRLGRPTVKLTDFGIAYAATAPALTATGVLAGTPAYFAPETARGEGTDSRTDVYSLGATLYAATEGHPPFGTDPDNMLALLLRIGHGGAPPPQRAGPLTDLLRRLLADVPAARPTAAEAHEALQRMAAAMAAPPGHRRAEGAVHPGAETVDPAASSGQGTARFATVRPVPRRWRWWLAAVAGVVVLAAAIVTTVIMTTARGPAEPGGPVAASTTGGPSSSGPATVGPVRIADERTADPCSLIDLAALRRHGEAELEEGTLFAQCRAAITRTDGTYAALFVSFHEPDEPADLLAATDQQQIGEIMISRSGVSPSAPQCQRWLTLSDGTIVKITVESFGGPPIDVCAVAETGATAAVDVVAERGIGTRTPLDVATPLARVDACSLLEPSDLMTVPPLDPDRELAGFGGWKCIWGDPEGDDSVYVEFLRGVPLTTEDGTLTDFSGHAGAYQAMSGGCRMWVTQRLHTADGSERADLVRIEIYGSRPEANLCDDGRRLANAAAPRLPPG